MEILYFTAAAVFFYFLADWILRAIERARGHTLEHRSLVFFGILLVLAVGGFQLIQAALAPPG